MSRHRPNATPEPVKQAATVLELLSAVCLEVGAIMEAERRRGVDEWHAWVESLTPFTVEEARRLRAVHLAHALLPQEMVDKLPRPWQALWTIPAGRIGKGMPGAAASSKRANGAELLAARLLQGSPRDLSTDVVAQLAAWLHERDSES